VSVAWSFRPLPQVRSVNGWHSPCLRKEAYISDNLRIMSLPEPVRLSTRQIDTIPCRIVAAVFVALFLIVPMWGQGISVGLKIGIPVTEYFETGRSGSLHGDAQYSAATRRYTLGASGEWHLTKSFGFEIDALYHRMGYVAIVNFFDSANGNFSSSSIDVKGSSWEFPVMAKYRFSPRYRPYIAGGGVLRYLGPVRGRGTQTNGSLAGMTSSTTVLDTNDPSELRKRFYPGLTVGSGIEFGAGPMHLLPEFRYTRWTSNISGPGGLLRFAPNQAEFMFGVLF
jgi:hypothetical protein